MNTTIEQSFNFEGWGVRVVTVDGEPHFVARDVAQILGYANPADAITRHCKGVVNRYPLRTAGGSQEVRVIAESDVLRLIVSSKLPAAEQFERFVFETVLPEIRRTGSYNAVPALPDLSTPEGVLALAQTLTKTAEELVAANEKIAADAPKVAYVDEYVSGRDVRLFRNVAKCLGMKESELRDDLLSRKWIYCETITRWSKTKKRDIEVHRYSAYADKTRYFYPAPNHDAPRFKGEAMHTLKITPRGAAAIAKLYNVDPEVMDHPGADLHAVEAVSA